MKHSTAFWDSSALIPLCVQEQTSSHARILAKQFVPVVWWATAVEIHSAIARLHRAGELNDAAQKAALDRLLVISQGWREILPSDQLRDQAETLLDTYSMRAADSLQLAAAMIWCQQKPRDYKDDVSDGTTARPACLKPANGGWADAEADDLFKADKRRFNQGPRVTPYAAEIAASAAASRSASGSTSM